MVHTNKLTEGQDERIAPRIEERTYGRLRFPTRSAPHNDDGAITPFTHMRKEGVGHVDNAKHVGFVLVHESFRPTA